MSALADKTYSVTQLARELGITARAIRFYEDRGLITPQRIGNTRAYTHRDRVRLVLILRGKKMGFTLKEIGEFLDLYVVDYSHVEQMTHLLMKVRERISILDEQLIAVQTSLDELREMERITIETLHNRGVGAKLAM